MIKINLYIENIWNPIFHFPPIRGNIQKFCKKKKKGSSEDYLKKAELAIDVADTPSVFHFNKVANTEIHTVV